MCTVDNTRIDPAKLADVVISILALRSLSVYVWSRLDFYLFLIYSSIRIIRKVQTLNQTVGVSVYLRDAK